MTDFGGIMLTRSPLTTYLFSTLKKKQQLFRYSITIKKTHPNVEEIYNNLIYQLPDTKPTPCNFISQVVDAWADKPNSLAIKSINLDNGSNEEITYTDIVNRSHQIAHFVKEQGLKKGDSIALMLGQDSAWWYSLAGLMRQGIGIVPCSRLLTSQDLIYRIKDLNINGIIATPELQEKIDAIRNECSSLKVFITTGPQSLYWLSLTEIFNKEIIVSNEETTANDPCLYLYTSGTTGQPKAVQHNNDYPYFHWPTGRRWLRATPDDLIYNASDTGWGFTVWITLAAWSMGSKLLITPTNKKFDPQKILHLLHKEPITIFCAAPTVLRILVVQRNFNSFSFLHLKRIVTVGEALDENVIEQFEKRGIEVAVGFGQAETPLLIGCVDKQSHEPNTMGKAIDPYQLSILDEALQPLPPGNIGQIAVDCVGGPKAGLMRRYVNDPEKTKNAFSPNGQYYLTGDWAVYKNNGFFTYQGRKDDLIKSRGYRIGPDEVEKAGMSHPAVAKIAVIGVRTKLDSYDITVKAFILLKPGYTGNVELINEIQNHIKNETAPNKYPRLIEFLSLNEWSQYETISGKIRRKALKELEENKLLENSDAVSDKPNQFSLNYNNFTKNYQ